MSDRPLSCCLGSGLLEQCFCFGEPPRLLQCLAQIQLERDPGVVVRREQRRRASEEVDRTDHVGSIECANARHAEPGGGARRQCSAGSAELFVEPSGLLEVVAEHLVELDEAGSVLVEPVRESLVELGPVGLRQRFVGGVSAQEMTEAEGLLVREQRRVRSG